MASEAPPPPPPPSGLPAGPCLTACRFCRTILGLSAMTQSVYIPDFTASVKPPDVARVMFITGREYRNFIEGKRVPRRSFDQSFDGARRSRKTRKPLAEPRGPRSAPGSSSPSSGSDGDEDESQTMRLETIAPSPRVGPADPPAESSPPAAVLPCAPTHRAREFCSEQCSDPACRVCVCAGRRASRSRRSSVCTPSRRIRTPAARATRAAPLKCGARLSRKVSLSNDTLSDSAVACLNGETIGRCPFCSCTR